MTTTMTVGNNPREIFTVEEANKLAVEIRDKFLAKLSDIAEIGKDTGYAYDWISIITKEEIKESQRIEITFTSKRGYGYNGKLYGVLSVDVNLGRRYGIANVGKVKITPKRIGEVDQIVEQFVDKFRNAIESEKASKLAKEESDRKFQNFIFNECGLYNEVVEHVRKNLSYRMEKEFAGKTNAELDSIIRHNCEGGSVYFNIAQIYVKRNGSNLHLGNVDDQTFKAIINFLKERKTL